MNKPHQHPCDHCDGFAWCDGDWEQDHDGSEVICDLYQRHRVEQVCEKCREARAEGSGD